MTTMLNRTGHAQAPARLVAARSIAGIISICIAIMARNSEVRPG